jgi:hypothetical protein
MNDERAASRLSQWQIAFIEQLKESIAPFLVRQLDLAALPPELRGHYIGADGIFALHILPAGDLWKHTELRRFVAAVE